MELVFWMGSKSTGETEYKKRPYQLEHLDMQE